MFIQNAVLGYWLESVFGSTAITLKLPHTKNDSWVSHSEVYRCYIWEKESTGIRLVFSITRYPELRYENQHQKRKSWIGASTKILAVPRSTQTYPFTQSFSQNRFYKSKWFRNWKKGPKKNDKGNPKESIITNSILFTLWSKLLYK